MKKYIQKIWKLLALQVLFFLLYSIASASIPYLTKILFDYDFSAGPGGLVWLGALYLVLIAVLYGAQYLSQLFSWKADRRFLFSLRADLMNGLFRRSYADFTEKSVGDYLSILTNDISALQQNWLEPAMDIINISLMVAVYAVVLFVFVDFRIAAVILAASLLTVFLPKVTAKELSRRRQREQALLERYTSKAKDLLEGFSFASRRTRPAFAREHETSLDRQQAATYKRGLFYSFSLVLNGACLSLINLSAFLAVGVLLWQGEITLGTGVATLGYIESFTMPIQYILESVNSLASVAAAAAVGRRGGGSAVPAGAVHLHLCLRQKICDHRPQRRGQKHAVPRHRQAGSAGGRGGLCGGGGRGGLRHVRRHRLCRAERPHLCGQLPGKRDAVWGV